MKLCGVGKGGGTSTPYVEASRAPCPRVTDRSRSYANAWARRTRGFIVKQGCASAFAHPTRSLRLSSSKENRPLFAALGQGVALIPVSSLPPQARGLARRQGAWPGLRQTGPGVRGSRAGPDRRALGVKRHAPRLAARQRGHLGFCAFDGGRTGPARSGRRGCPSTDRGRRLRKSSARGCRSHSPPTERLRKAPLVEWIGMASA